VGQILRRDALAGVRDRDEDVVRAALGADGDAAAGRRIPDGVLEEVADDLGELVGVAAGREPIGRPPPRA
jgi:hypothetical protein